MSLRWKRLATSWINFCKLGHVWHNKQIIVILTDEFSDFPQFGWDDFPTLSGRQILRIQIFTDLIGANRIITTISVESELKLSEVSSNSSMAGI
jgi:hypothetical protein